MKAEELSPKDLRIGNLVTLSGSLILTVYEIHEDCFYAKDTEGSSFKNTWSELHPIPLSEEVLLKCGFGKCEKHDNFYFIKLNDWTKIYVAFHEKQYAVELSVSKHSFCPKVKHLHQLQNIYYALTGEELDVSL